MKLIDLWRTVQCWKRFHFVIVLRLHQCNNTKKQWWAKCWKYYIVSVLGYLKVLAISCLGLLLQLSFYLRHWWIYGYRCFFSKRHAGEELTFVWRSAFLFMFHFDYSHFRLRWRDLIVVREFAIKCFKHLNSRGISEFVVPPSWI